MPIQWYPGHMARAKRTIRELIRYVDVVIEVLDARIPVSSRNPDLAELLERRPRAVALNKADLADPAATRRWAEYLRAQNAPAVPVDAGRGTGVRKLLALAGKLAGERPTRRGPARALVAGIPNVGKSSLINRLAGRAAARTGENPGVTRGRQWLKAGDDLELLDLPGILWPKLDDGLVALHLAITGAIPEERYDSIDVATRLLGVLATEHRAGLQRRYGLVTLSGDGLETLAEIGRRRGMLRRGGEVDTLAAARAVLGDFRDGRLGRLTLEMPPSE